MIKKLLCKVFGHKVYKIAFGRYEHHCARCRMDVSGLDIMKIDVIS